MSRHAPAAERTTRSTSPFINAMSADERREHMRAIGARGNAGRLVLTADEKSGLIEAYRLLDRIAKRHGIDLAAPVEGEAGDA